LPEVLTRLLRTSAACLSADGQKEIGNREVRIADRAGATPALEEKEHFEIQAVPQFKTAPIKALFQRRAFQRSIIHN
jgi:hypothetical protein